MAPIALRNAAHHYRTHLRGTFDGVACSGAAMISDFPDARSYQLKSELKVTRKLLEAANPNKSGVDMDRHKESLRKKIDALEAELAAYVAREAGTKVPT
jgi:hypothetical protein